MGLRFLVIGLSILNHSLTAAGHEVFHIHHRDNPHLLLNHPITTNELFSRLNQQGFQPDIVFIFDDGNLPLLIDPQTIPCPAIFYSIDSYCNPWHFSYAHGFDLALVAQKNFLQLFEESGIHARWFPLFCYNESKMPNTPRDVPVSFVGTLGHKNNPSRLPFFNSFRKYQPLVLMSGDYKPIFTRSQIVLNQTAFGELNFRCFEAMECGAALLMEKSENGFNEIFTEGENILPPFTRNDGKQAAEIASHWLKYPAELAQIAKNGFEHVQKYHSAKQRANQLVEFATDLLANYAHNQRLNELENRNILVNAAYGILASELNGEQWTAYRDFYANLARMTNPNKQGK